MFENLSVLYSCRILVKKYEEKEVPGTVNALQYQYKVSYSAWVWRMSRLTRDGTAEPFYFKPMG